MIDETIKKNKPVNDVKGSKRHPENITNNLTYAAQPALLLLCRIIRAKMVLNETNLISKINHALNHFEVQAKQTGNSEKTIITGKSILQFCINQIIASQPHIKASFAEDTKPSKGKEPIFILIDNLKKEASYQIELLELAYFSLNICHSSYIKDAHHKKVQAYSNYLQKLYNIIKDERKLTKNPFYNSKLSKIKHKATTKVYFSNKSSFMIMLIFISSLFSAYYILDINLSNTNNQLTKSIELVQQLK